MDFNERWFGVSPDSGDGSLELLWVIVILVSPGFCRNLGSGGEPECLHFIGVLSFDDEFREAVTWGGIQEKFRHALA